MATGSHDVIKNKRQNKEESPDNTTVNAGFLGSRPDQQKKPFKGIKEGPSDLNRVLDRRAKFMAPRKSLRTTRKESAGSSSRTAN